MDNNIHNTPYTPFAFVINIEDFVKQNPGAKFITIPFPISSMPMPMQATPISTTTTTTTTSSALPMETESTEESTVSRVRTEEEKIDQENRVDALREEIIPLPIPKAPTAGSIQHLLNSNNEGIFYLSIFLRACPFYLTIH